MKKIILFIAISFMVITATKAQVAREQDYRYHSLAECQGDTLEFLLRNFYPSRHFWGKSVADVIEILDREMPVKQIAYHTCEEPHDSVFQSIELIFDDRKQYVFLNQLHFWAAGFEHEGENHLTRDVEALLGFGPDEIVALTPELRERLKHLIFVYRGMMGTNLSAIKVRWPQ